MKCCVTKSSLNLLRVVGFIGFNLTFKNDFCEVSHSMQEGGLQRLPPATVRNLTVVI